MANFCLMPEAINRFKAALVSGKINPDKLAEMTSEERRALFKDIVGDDAAQHTNALFESKLLLKNKQQGYITWAKQVAGITPEARRDLITRIQKMDHILNPDEEKAFLQDLASTKLGVNVTAEEAKRISDLSHAVSEAQSAQKADGTFSSEAERLQYGRSKVALGNYVNELKLSANKFKPSDVVMHPGKTVTATASIAKSVKASLDDSALFRQGWKTLFTNPVSWQRNALKSFSDIVKEFGKQNVLDEIHADIMSRPNYERMVKAKLAVSNIEEAYPSQLPEKIPLLGRAYKASESAFTGFLYRQRADIFDKYIDIAKKSGVNIDDTKQLEALGKLVNSLTGRGHLGGLEPAANTVNSIFFSPRSVKANIDTLTAHQFQKNITPFVRKQAALATAKVIAGTAAVMALANAIKPGSVEFDPRSSDFGKIRIGDTRFDVSGGMASIATLAARLVTQSSKSSTTGTVKKLNSGFGSQSGWDVLNSFAQSKLSPAAGVIRDLITQKDFNGNKPTVGGEVSNFITPLPIANVAELQSDPNSANALLAETADALGIATNTYGNTPQGTNGTNPQISSALSKAHFSVSPPQRTQRNTDLTDQQYSTFTKKSNQYFIDAVNKALADPQYKALSADNQNKTLAKALSNARSKALDQILPNTAKPKKGDPGYYQYQAQQRQAAKTKVKIKTY